MAIDYKNYNKITTNIYRHKQFHNKFYFRVKIDNKLKYKTLNIKEKLNATQYKNIALKEYTKFYKLISNPKPKNDKYSQIETFGDLYKFYRNGKSQEKLNTIWEIKKHRYYLQHMQQHFKNVKLNEIKVNDIHYFYNVVLGNKKLSNRYIKTSHEILKPLFDFAYQNNIIQEDIANKIKFTRTHKKKIVSEATQKYLKIIEGINTIFENNVFYKVLFLFGFSGRRKGEVLGLKWENIDLNLKTYIIEDTKNGETQKYKIMDFLINDLISLKFYTGNSKYVFQSKFTNSHITSFDWQTQKLKNYLGMPNFSFHLMRHILVSYLSEQGVEAITLSGVLGHKNTHSINTYLSQNTFNASQKMDEINKKNIIPSLTQKEIFALKQQLKNIKDSEARQTILNIIKANQ